MRCTIWTAGLLVVIVTRFEPSMSPKMAELGGFVQFIIRSHVSPFNVALVSRSRKGTDN